MKLVERTGKAAAVILSLAFLFPALASADTTTFTASQTVANVTTANTQTLATSSSVANVPQVKATRTITVVNVPTVPTVLTIGSCAITISNSPAADSDCTNGSATIATSTASTQALIATALRTTITGYVDNVNGHGALTTGSSGATVTYTTAGTEASSTAINASLSAGSDITLTPSTAGTVPVAQVWIATPANVDIGDTFTANINGTSIPYVATAATVANVTAGLTAAINASAQASAVTAANGTTQITVTSDTAGTAFTLTASASNGSPVAQTVTFTPLGPEAQDSFIATVNSSTYTYVVASGDTVKEVVEGLVTKLATDSAVNCSEDDVKVTCVAKTPGTAFTYDASVATAPTATHHGGGGGGGGSSHTITTTTVSTPVVTTTTTTSGTASVGVATWPVMTKGATGASVTALQTWLLAKGYSIPAGATGYFGAQTTAALAAFQAASGISPAVGYFGPITRAYIASH